MAAYEEEEYKAKKVDKSIWIKIFKQLGENKKNLIYLAIFMSLQAIVDIVFPLLHSYAIDNFVGNTSLKMLDLYIFVTIYICLIIAQTCFVYNFFLQAGKIEMGFSYSMRKRAFKKLQELSFEYYDVNSSGWILARVTSDIARLAEIVSWSMTDLVWGIAVMILISGVMLMINWKLALIVFVAVPVIYAISAYFQKRILEAYRITRKANSKITSAFNEAIMGAKTTKTLVLEASQEKEFDGLTTEYRAKSIHAALLNSLFMPIVTGISSICIALLLNFGGHNVLVGGLKFGTLVLFINYTQTFFEPLRQISGLMAELQMAQANAERVMGLLERESAITDNEAVIKKYGTLLEPNRNAYEPLHGDIKFDDVTFYYNSNEIVLDHFNLEIKQGETIALVGETGSGKSSIVNLICRFYEPKNGRILIDGIDYKERSIGWLHSNLGYVLQTPYLFSGTIKENIKFGKPDATDEEVVRVAKMVNVHDFIMSLENGYDTNVNEGGSRLSTGEKQLISFARALLVDPKLLILDEATSSIDTEKEQMIKEAIDVVQKDRTCIMVAHRLSTVVDASKILVLKKGKIIEQGTHNELMAMKGHYYRLYTNQFKEYQEASLLRLKKEKRKEQLV